MNESLVRFGEIPITRKYLNRQGFPEKSMLKFKERLRNSLFGLEKESSLGVEEEWLCQLKKKFAFTFTKSEKVTILTLLPNKLAIVFGRESF